MIHLFSHLSVVRDGGFRAAALNMAIDEALLEMAQEPTIRFYRWDHPALSFGYFGRFADVAAESNRDRVRRWTGGGIVLHGDDLTYAIIIPAQAPAFAESSTAIYEATHRAIQRALAKEGVNTALAPVAAAGVNPPWPDRRNLPGVAVGGHRNNPVACFANPVRADVMLEGRKIAGAAQRRTRRGLLQQGSVQQVNLTGNFSERFAGELAPVVDPATISDGTLERAEAIAAEKYATDAWLRRR